MLVTGVSVCVISVTPNTRDRDVSAMGMSLDVSAASQLPVEPVCRKTRPLSGPSPVVQSANASHSTVPA